MPGNRVTRDPQGFVRLDIVGPQTRATVLQLRADTIPLARALRAEGRDASVLVDYTLAGHVDRTARAALFEGIKSDSLDRVSLVGSNVILKHLIFFVFSAAGLRSRIRHFSDTSEAAEWLVGSDPAHLPGSPAA